MRIGGWQQAADGRPGVAPWSLWMDLSGDAELVLSSTSLLLAGFSGRCRNCTSPLPATSSAIASCETRICSSDGSVCVCVCVSRGGRPLLRSTAKTRCSDALDDSLLVCGRRIHATWGEKRTTPAAPLATDAAGAHVCCPTCASENFTAAGHVGSHPGGRRKLRPACCIHHRRGE